MDGNFSFSSERQRDVLRASRHGLSPWGWLPVLLEWCALWKPRARYTGSVLLGFSEKLRSWSQRRSLRSSLAVRCIGIPHRLEQYSGAAEACNRLRLFG